MTLPTMPDTLILDTPFYLAMVRVPAGEFIMGSDPNRDNFAQFDELPQHRVYVSEFYIGRYEVTNAQYMIYARVNGLPFEFPTGNDDHPVVHISWGETVGFCQWLSQVTGESVRLPTEAEWEVRHEVAWRPVARSKEMPPDSLLSASYLHRRRRQRGGLKLQGQCSLISKDVTRMSVSYTL